MKDEQDFGAATGEPHPIEIMRAVYRDMDFSFEEVESMLTFRLALENLDITVISWGHPGDVARLIVKIPVRAQAEFRSRAGEFLHRLNFNAKRKFWEMDHNDGEIRLAAYTDTVLAPLSESLFRSAFHALTTTADITFPYLTSVLFGRMTPEFAADQAEAALDAFWDNDEKPDNEPPETNDHFRVN